MFTEAHIHPMFVHFPIALGMTGYLFYCIYFFFKRDSKCYEFFSFFTLLLASVAAICTVVTGSYFTFDLIGEAGQLKNIHSSFASAATTCFCIGSGIQMLSYLIKKNLNQYKWIVFSVFTAAFILIMITGFYGGAIVYDHLLIPGLK